MIPHTHPWLRRLAGGLAFATLVSGLVLASWCAVDRRRAGPKERDLPALVATTQASPSSAGYARLSRAQSAAGRAEEAATSAALAARLAPNDPIRAARAESALDAALRARARDGIAPFAVLSAAFLASGAFSRRRRARCRRIREKTVARTSGRVVLTVEGPGDASGDVAVIRPGCSALIVDAHVGAALADLEDRPPLVVALSHAQGGRTVRLSAKRDYPGGAARFRVVGDALRELERIPGRWRVLVRADDALLAEGSVRVEPTAASRAA